MCDEEGMLVQLLLLRCCCAAAATATAPQPFAHTSMHAYPSSTSSLPNRASFRSVIMMTNSGYIKRLPIEEFEAQSRGGKVRCTAT